MDRHTAQHIASRLATCLDASAPDITTETIGDDWYIVVDDGIGVFAAEAEAVAAWLAGRDDEPADYSEEYCQGGSPDIVSDRAIALEMARRGYRLCRGGDCQPVLIGARVTVAAESEEDAGGEPGRTETALVRRVDARGRLTIAWDAGPVEVAADDVELAV